MAATELWYVCLAVIVSLWFNCGSGILSASSYWRFDGNEVIDLRLLFENWIYGFGEIHFFVLLAVFCFLLELFLFARVDNSELWECKRDEWALSSLSIEG